MINNLLIKSIVGVFLCLITAIILLCIGLLMHGYLTSQIVYQESIFKVLNINFGLQEFYSSCWQFIGTLLIALAPLILVVELKSKKTLYILIFIGCLCLLTSFIIFINATRLEPNWWNYSNKLLSDLFVLYVVLKTIKNAALE